MSVTLEYFDHDMLTAGEAPRVRVVPDTPQKPEFTPVTADEEPVEREAPSERPEPRKARPRTFTDKKERD